MTLQSQKPWQSNGSIYPSFQCETSYCRFDASLLIFVALLAFEAIHDLPSFLLMHIELNKVLFYCAWRCILHADFIVPLPEC